MLDKIAAKDAAAARRKLGQEYDGLYDQEDDLYADRDWEQLEANADRMDEITDELKNLPTIADLEAAGAYD